MNLQKILREVNKNSDNILIANTNNDDVSIFTIDLDLDLDHYNHYKIKQLNIENDYFEKNKKTLLFVLKNIKHNYNNYTCILILRNKICLYDIEKKKIMSKKYNLSVLGIMNFLNDNQLL